MRKQRISITIIAVCAMVVAVCVLLARKGDGQDEQATTQHKDKSHPAAVVDSSAKIISKSATTKSTESDLKFLDIMWPFLPEKYQKMFEEAKAAVKEWPPKTFSELAGGVELVGHIANSGKLMDFYAELQKALAADPDNLNLLRMMVLVSSIQGFAEGEYEKNLSRLAQLDSNADVLFPYAQVQLENGDPKAAYSSIQKSVTEHPDQAPSILTSALRIFVKAKADEQKTLVVGKLKGLELDAFQADCCGRYLYDANDTEDAVYFYKQNENREHNPFFREAAQVRLCKVQIAKGTQDERTITTLKELAMNSDTPAIKAEANKALASINVELPYQSDNSNKKSNNNL